MTQKELEKYLMDAANILRGMIDAADFKQYIFPLLFFKRISDVWDEEFAEALAESDGDLDYAKFRENHRFQIQDGCHWDDVRKVSVDVGLALHNALRGIENANFELLHDVFGDAQWTNKRRMSDEKLLDLIEHFSKINLSVANVPHDLMGEGYEYLIKKFADDSGHTAAEFYTNRTVVKLMTLITDPQPQESVYDPTCGSGGILLNSVLYLKEQGKEYRNVKLYGQELNLITSAIARINMFMHNVDEFLIVQGDTLDNPQILEDDELKRFDVVMANPPYSVKRWNQAKFTNDPFGRNIWGTPPQGCADYAFIQHIIKSLDSQTGRCVVLLPHGILFRDSESEIRKRMIEADAVDAVIGLGKNLFYNSSMESCLLVCRNNKPQERRGKIIFIDARDEIRIDRSSAHLEEGHIQKISETYHSFACIDGFACVRTNQEVLSENDGNLSIQLYVNQARNEDDINLNDLLTRTKAAHARINQSFTTLVHQLEALESITTNNGFRKVKFGEIAFNISERVDPKETSDGVYVGLEHLDPNNLRIERRGKPTDVIGTKLRIYKGDIIFGKRRAYQRKVAVADFDGIVSAHSMVLRANEEAIEKDFLPLLMQSDSFMNRAVQISEGSLSPTIKWKTLANQEFEIPDRNSQQTIVGLFRDFEESTDNAREFEEIIRKLRFKVLNSVIARK